MCSNKAFWKSFIFAYSNMALAFTGANFTQLISIISPFLLGFFVIMSSIFSLNFVKGIIYFAGILIAAVINALLMNVVSEGKNGNPPSIACGLVDIPGVGIGGSPSPSGVFIAFTSAYLLLPMYYNDRMNFGVMISLFVLQGVDIVAKVINGCTSYVGAALGSLVGFVLGSAWYVLFKATGHESLIYFNELDSNKVMCSRPSKQTFKCSVYKHGELITSNTV